MKTTVINSNGVQEGNSDSLLTDYLKKKMLKETLKFAAGKQMFCKNCGQILDWKTTVVIHAQKEGSIPKNGAHSVTVIICKDCFDPAGKEKLEKGGYGIVIDKWEE